MEVAMVVDGSGRGFVKVRFIFGQSQNSEPHSVGFECKVRSAIFCCSLQESHE
jgi:hypothetical protein